MAVVFLRGQQLGRSDLNIFLVDVNRTPKDAAEITYALYDYTTGSEVVVGSSQRTPAHPSVGEYYASVVIPLDANMGSYRIRWTFRETVSGPIQQVVQEFEVVDRVPETVSSQFSLIETDLIRRLRILLRDNCLGAEETVEFDVAGEKMVISMGDLWEALHDLNPTTP